MVLTLSRYTINKIPSSFQNTEAKTLLLMFASLVALDGFQLLLSSQLTADLTPEWCGGSMFHPLSDIYAETPLYYVGTVDQLWATRRPLWTQLSHWQTFMKDRQTLSSDIFISFDIPRNFNLRSVKTRFFCIFRDNCWLWVTLAVNSICVFATAFKASISPLNRFFFPTEQCQNNTYQDITLLEQSFSLKKVMLYQHPKFRLFHCFENL